MWKKPFIITCPKCSQAVTLVHPLLWWVMVFQTLQTGSWEGTHPQTEWWTLNPSPKDILGPLWYQMGAFFLHALKLRIPRHDSYGLGAGRACGAFSRCTRSLKSAVLQVWAVRLSHQVKSYFGKLGAPLPPSLTPSAFHMRLFLLDRSWISVILSVLSFNNKSKLFLLN